MVKQRGTESFANQVLDTENDMELDIYKQEDLSALECKESVSGSVVHVSYIIVSLVIRFSKHCFWLKGLKRGKLYLLSITH